MSPFSLCRSRSVQCKNENILSLGILYSENGTLGVKSYRESMSKHVDVYFNFIIILINAIPTDC